MITIVLLIANTVNSQNIKVEQLYQQRLKKIDDITNYLKSNETGKIYNINNYKLIKNDRFYDSVINIYFDKPTMNKNFGANENADSNSLYVKALWEYFKLQLNYFDYQCDIDSVTGFYYTKDFDKPQILNEDSEKCGTIYGKLKLKDSSINLLEFVFKPNSNDLIMFSYNSFFNGEENYVRPFLDRPKKNNRKEILSELLYPRPLFK